MKTDFLNTRLPRTGDMFVGREKECDFLLNSLLNNQSCDLMGLRRIGKTSVLCEIERRLLQTRQDTDFVLREDLSVYTDGAEDPESQLYAKLTDELDEEMILRENNGGLLDENGLRKRSKLYSSVYVAPDSSGKTNRFRFFEAFLKKFRKRTSGRFYLLLDEFDSCCTYGERLAGFLKRLRHLIDSSMDTGFVCVVATSRAITMLESKTNGDASTLHNVLQHCDLHPFDRREFDGLCDLSRLAVSGAMRDLMFNHAFGHPYLSTILLHHYNKDTSNLLEDTVKFEVVLANAAADFEDYFRELKNVFSSFSTDRSVVDSGVGNWFDCLVWRECYHTRIPQHVLETFRRYGFWKCDSKLPNSVVTYLRRYRTEVWPELRNIEKRLRHMVAGHLRSKYGDDWFHKMVLPEHGVSTDPWKTRKKPFQEEVDERLAKLRREAPGAKNEHLDCTYLDDLLHLMLVDCHWRDSSDGKWVGFHYYFQDDIQKCRDVILTIGNVRNPEAHFRDYPEALKLRFHEQVDYLTRILDMYERGNA